MLVWCIAQYKHVFLTGYLKNIIHFILAGMIIKLCKLMIICSPLIMSFYYIQLQTNQNDSIHLVYCSIS